MTGDGVFVPGQGLGIEHLASWIGARFGATPASAAPAPAWLGAALADSRSVVLLLLDGVGVRQVADHAPRGALAQARVATLRSVFPSSTAPAITALASGLPPHRHGNPGWFAWHPGLGRVVRTLPSDFRGDPAGPVDPDGLWRWTPLTAAMNPAPVCIQPAPIADSAFSRYAYRGARRVGYADLDELHDRIVEAVDAPEGGFVYAYAPQFDTAAHIHGCRHPRAGQVLSGFSELFGRLGDSLARRDALLLATADHGFTDIAPERQLALADYPALAGLLDRPLVGEPRVAFAQPGPGALDEFLGRAAEELGHAFEPRLCTDLAAAGWFGAGEADPAFLAHAGSVALVGREGWSLVDSVPGEKAQDFIGMHGGTTADEMLVPLAAVRRGRPLARGGSASPA